MTIATKLLIVSLIIFPAISLAQISNTLDSTASQVYCTQQYDPVCGASGKTYSNECMAKIANEPVKYKGECKIEATMPEPAPILIPKLIPKLIPEPVPEPVLTKCGVSFFEVKNECGAGAYKYAHARCYGDYEITLGGESSCKPAELWNQYVKEQCASRCLVETKELNIVFQSSPEHQAQIQTQQAPTPLSASTININTGKEGHFTQQKIKTQRPAYICPMSDKLMQEYNQFIIELQKAEAESDKAKTEQIINQIIQLKQEIVKQQNECANAPQQPTPATISRSAVPAPMPIIKNEPLSLSIDRCAELAQWESKIAYYKKISGLNNSDLKKNGFSREEINRIMQELLSGIEKVKTQCDNQKEIIAAPSIAAGKTMPVAETIKPVVVESGQEITSYYKVKLEKTASINGTEKQIEELKNLRNEIDGLVANLIKSRTELESSELNTLVKEVKISQGEIKADDIAVKTTGKKIFVNIGNSSVSVEPTANQVTIRDKGLEVKASEIKIKENIMSVGGIDVKMSASEVTEKLDLKPTIIGLKEENSKAVYTMQIDERRKLFGFIPFNTQRTVSANAENGEVISEQRSWYSFLTTK